MAQEKRGFLSKLKPAVPIALVLWTGLVLWISTSDVAESDAVAEAIFPYWRAAVRLYHSGSGRQCNLCNSEWRSFEMAPEGELECPKCRSRPRHRTTWIYFNERTNLFDGRPKKMLHVAPEPAIAPLLRREKYIDYISGDLDPSRAMVKLDVTQIQYPDDTFDVIYCSHVLEHVPDHHKAMRELYRVLKPGGWAVIAVPILLEKTFEDASITTPEQRDRFYGQFDHVRAYGKDFKDFLEAAGFKVTVDRFADTFSREDVEYHALSREEIYFCEKLPSNAGGPAYEDQGVVPANPHFSSADGQSTR